MTPTADGWIEGAPVQWTRGRIKNLIASATNGTWGDEPAEDGSDVRCIRAADFDRVGRRAKVDGAPLRSIDASSLRQHLLHPGDLILEKSGGGEKQPVGMAVLYEGAEKAVCSNFCSRISPASEVDSRFLTYVFAAAYGQGLTQSAIKQTTGIQNLDAGAFFSSPWAYPESEDQRRIADFLDAETARIDRLAKHDQKLLGLLGERRKAVIDHEVDASSRLLTKLFWKLSVLRDGTHQPPPRVDLGVPLLTARNVSGGDLRLTDLDTHVSEDDAKLLEKSLRMMVGDVLLSVKGTIGACAVAPAGFPRSVLDRNVALLRPLPEYSSEWLAFVLRSTGLQDQMRISVTAAAQPGLPLGVIRELRVPDVPLSEQEGRVDRISARCREIDQVVDRVKRKGSLLSERRQALITAAATGQFDVTTASGRNVTDGVSA
ncbi:hypothetical protein [Streptomyces sp. NBC_01285]|uniref:hypothetical protein n=1 Tax=Streptomyces sp. NBC_01285 TaxID=2903813 RepID=UPI0022553F23|nr:hypothetical protein [Streptomyces sp. NBC_01285]MCX4771647.1 hypothetical protein [Streptomyces sp. NBC_01285]